MVARLGRFQVVIMSALRLGLHAQKQDGEEEFSENLKHPCVL